MNMDLDIKKIAAACCSGLAVLLVLVLPDIRLAVNFLQISLPIPSYAGYELISQGNLWIWLPLLYGIAMTVCTLLLDGKISAVVCGVGVFVPVLCFALMKGQVVQQLRSYIPSSITSYAINGIMSMGEGLVLASILALAAAILCLLAGLRRQATHHTAGLEAGNEDEW